MISARKDNTWPSCATSRSGLYQSRNKITRYKGGGQPKWFQDGPRCKRFEGRILKWQMQAAAAIRDAAIREWVFLTADEKTSLIRLDFMTAENEVFLYHVSVLSFKNASAMYYFFDIIAWGFEDRFGNRNEKGASGFAAAATVARTVTDSFG
ncbi:hypothetical protein CsSME_00002327 [Camellia sinensis var. sinensis]